MSELFSGNRVVKFQELGVQKIFSIAGEAGEMFKRLAGQGVQRMPTRDGRWILVG